MILWQWASFVGLFLPAKIPYRKYRKVPNEILAIEGLHNFNVKVNLNAFRDNFHIFYKYCDSTYYMSLMLQYKKVYNNEKFRNKSVNKLRKKSN